MSAAQVKLSWWVKRNIKSLYKRRFSLDEIYIYYRGVIPHSQLISIVKGIKRQERI